MLNPVTWVVWTGVVAAIAIWTRNPLYLTLLLGVVTVHYLPASRRRPDARAWQSLLRIVLGMTLLIIPFNALNVHVGQHVIFRLPDNWPLIGGDVTLEAVIAGACNALSLATLIALFATFNMLITQAQLLRLTPAFIYEAGLILSIALTFIPHMMSSAHEIREAQRIRGHRMRRLRDMLPFLMALLTTAMERSFQLAEAMEARGFGLPAHDDLFYKGLTLLGLGGLLSGSFVLTYTTTYRRAGWSAAILGTLVLLGTFWARGRSARRTFYRRTRWTWRDALVLGMCTAVTLVVVGTRLRHPESFTYYPYTEIMPPFHFALGASLVALAMPALLVGHEESGQ